MQKVTSCPGNAQQFQYTVTRDTENGVFQQDIYRELDEKLKSSDWKSGASEAHGLLTGLACRGFSATEIGNNVHLLQLDYSKYGTLLEGLFELIIRDLESPEPVFNLMLPVESTDNRELAEDLSGWCQGFLQGVYNDGTAAVEQCSDSVRELMADIMNIGNLDVTSIDREDHDAEKSLVEIEEFLRVGIQLTYDEMVGHPGTAATPGNPQIH